jgi:hypothetical protein
MSRRHSPRSYIPCPTPWKVAFLFREGAEQRIGEINSTSTHRTKTPQRTYACDCGSWHLTSKG